MEVFRKYLTELQEDGFIDPKAIIESEPEIGAAVVEDLEIFVQLHSDDASEGVRESLGTLGDYTLRRKIGKGGMGVVYDAWQNSMNRQVALKVLPAGIAADTKASARFLREAQTAGQLNHQNVVGVYGLGIEANTPFYSMEYVDGETLAQIIARQKDATPEEKTAFGFPRDEVAYYSTIARCFAEVADGLQHAHSKGIIHRDIKPSNLILDREGRLRILDFGLAHLEGQESLTASSGLLGTPLYMSPEQARGKKFPGDHRTDIYSLGATMYEMLTWRPPFKGKDHQETLSQIIERDPVEPRKENLRVPREFETIVLKCLRKEPAERYGTAEALSQDLRRFARGDPIEARPESGWEKMGRRVRRHKSLIAVGAMFLMISMLGVLIGVGLLWKEKTKTENALKAVLRLSDLKRLATCKSEAEVLWPCTPLKIDDMEDWLRRARELVRRLPVHRITLEAMEKQAEIFEEENQDKSQSPRIFEDTETQWHYETLLELVRDLEEFARPADGIIQDVEKRLAFSRTIRERSIDRYRKEWDSALESIASMKECPQYRGLKIKPQVGIVPIGRDPNSGLWEFAHLQTGEIPPRDENGKLVLTEGTGLIFVLIPGGSFKMGAVRPNLGVVFTEQEENLQVGKVPSDSFGAELGLKAGDILLSVNDVEVKDIQALKKVMSGLRSRDRVHVACLRQGERKTFEKALGSNIDPYAESNECPVHEVILESFFISKYEMTQGQWFRFTGENPSIFRPPQKEGQKECSLLHPVEQVSWEMCQNVLTRLGLVLPTEAQWEYAARAGRDSVWWTGDERESLRDAANLADLFCREHGGSDDWSYEEWMDDGYMAHAPVGLYRANDFGLHDVAGNVFEWCGDYFGLYDHPVESGTGKLEIVNSRSWPIRGGSWNFNAVLARSSFRRGGPAGTRYRDLGVRPARLVQR